MSLCPCILPAGPHHTFNPLQRATAPFMRRKFQLRFRISTLSLMAIRRDSWREEIWKCVFSHHQHFTDQLWSYSMSFIVCLFVWFLSILSAFCRFSQKQVLTLTCLALEIPMFWVTAEYFSYQAYGLGALHLSHRNSYGLDPVFWYGN